MMHGDLTMPDEMTFAQLERFKKLSVTAGASLFNRRVSNIALLKKLCLASRTCLRTHDGTVCRSSSISSSTRWAAHPFRRSSMQKSNCMSARSAPPAVSELITKTMLLSDVMSSAGSLSPGVAYAPPCNLDHRDSGPHLLLAASMASLGGTAARSNADGWPRPIDLGDFPVRAPGATALFDCGRRGQANQGC